MIGHATATLGLVVFGAATPGVVDDCAEHAGVDDQMTCYVQRFCREPVTDADRAACYATVIRSLLADAPVGDAPDSAPPAAGTFGLSTEDIVKRDRSAPEEDPPRDMSARVHAIVERSFGLRIFALDNGQVWEELEPSRARLKTGDGVRIVRGSLNSYKLLTDRGGHARVRRVPCETATDDDTIAKCHAIARAADA